ncbi:MAG: hypothetical protein GXP13_06375 [Gammaproteobacteria bacterium]|nr:hypothetical protein [Gammaproteobacteria bacterium]
MINKNILLAGLLLVQTTTTLAQNSVWYQFEVIIFSYTNPQYTETEIWPDKAGSQEINNPLAIITNPPDSLGTPVLSEPVIDKANFKRLEDDQLILKKEAAAVKRSSLRKLILHTGWLQTMHAKNDSSPVVIRVGKEYTTLIPDPDYIETLQNTIPESILPKQTTEEIPAISLDDQTLTDADITTEQETGIADAPADTINQTPINIVPMIPSRVTELDGTIEISIARYLHIWTDLLINRPISSPAFIEQDSEYVKLETLRFQDHRRMRSKELHYIDNPAFGILIYALPYKTIVESK